MSLEDINGSSAADGQELQESEIESNAETLRQSVESPSAENSQELDKMSEAGNQDKAEDVVRNEIDQKLYDEVLEKLDIRPKGISQELQANSIQEKQPQREEKSQETIQVENAIALDFDKIQKLMQTGIINSAQGQNLKKQVLEKAFDKLVQTEKIRRNLPPVLNQPQTDKHQFVDKNEVFEEFSKSNPDFFTHCGRKEVLDYLKSEDVIIGKDELSKISNVIRSVEKAAIDRYLQKVTHEKTLIESNDAAKRRLTANAQKSGSSSNLSRTFTREQIGKMSSAEFAKYESVIMENLKKGLIK